MFDNGFPGATPMQCGPFAALVQEANTQIVQQTSKTATRQNPGQIRDTVQTVLAPAHTLKRISPEPVDHLIDLDSKDRPTGRLIEGLNGPFNLTVEERLKKEMSSSRLRAGSAPEKQGDIFNVLVLAALAERQPDSAQVVSWIKILDAKGLTPFGFMTGIVADAIVNGIDLTQTGVDLSGTRWSPALGEEMLETIVDIYGAEATDGYAAILVDRITQANQPDAKPGLYETPDGSVIVSIIGLSRAGLTPFAPAATFQTVFGRSVKGNADLLAQLPERLEGSAYLWSGPIGEQRMPARQIAEAVLQSNGWLRPWSAPVDNDRLGLELCANPLAYPRGMAERSVNGVEDSMVSPNNGDQAQDFDEIGADNRDTAAESLGPLKLLVSRDAQYKLAPLSITVIGKQMTGKTTLLSGIVHDLLRGSLQLVPGYEVAFSDATQRFAMTNADEWAQGADRERTKSILSRYGLSLGPVDVELTDIRGHELDQVGATDALDIDVAEGDTRAARRVRDQAQLAGQVRRTHGMIVMCATPEFVQAAREGEDALDQAAKHRLDLQRVAMPNIIKQIERVNGSRGADHRPVALVVNHGDEIFAPSDMDAVYQSAALLGDEDRAGFGTASVGDHIKSYALRTAIGTVSIASQSKVARIIDLLKPILGFVARTTRCFEIFLTTGLPHAVEDSRQLASGPGQILQWLLVSLLPSYVAQALEQVEADAKALAGFEAVQKTAQAYARPLLMPGRVQDMIEALPGGRKLLKRYRARLTAKLKVNLIRCDIVLEDDGDPIAIETALQLLEERIGFTRDAIETAAAELEEFRVSLSTL